MKRLLIVTISFVFVLSSCVKDIPGIENPSTNIFDEDYDGDQWFEIIDTYKYFNDVGQQRVKFEVKIPEENFPGLRPTAVDVACRLTGEDYAYFPIYLNIWGEYEFDRDFVPNIEDQYCFELGLISDTDSTIINSFIECVSL